MLTPSKGSIKLYDVFFASSFPGAAHASDFASHLSLSAPHFLSHAAWQSGAVLHATSAAIWLCLFPTHLKEQTGFPCACTTRSGENKKTLTITDAKIFLIK